MNGWKQIHVSNDFDAGWPSEAKMEATLPGVDQLVVVHVSQ